MSRFVKVKNNEINRILRSQFDRDITAHALNNLLSYRNNNNDDLSGNN